MPPTYSNISGILPFYAIVNNKLFEAGLKVYNERLFTAKAHNYCVIRKGL